MIVSRTELAWRTRLFYLAPWFALGLAVYHFNQQDGGVFPPVQPWRLIVYTFYYLGAGIAHFAPAAAPWLTGFALTVIGLAANRIRDFRAAMPWVALLLFAAVGAALTGMGRGFTEDHATALIQRYVSFSILFWIGWLGFLARAREDGVGWHTGSLAGLIGLVALINAGQMTYEAKVLGRDSRGVAQTICSQWPNLDESFLAGLIYSGAEAARTDLQGLHDLDFAPFDTCVAQPARR
jgi:hypothetical protein